MGVNSLPKSVCDCNLNLRPSVPDSCTLTTRLLSHPNVSMPFLKSAPVAEWLTPFSRFLWPNTSQSSSRSVNPLLHSTPMCPTDSVGRVAEANIWCCLEYCDCVITTTTPVQQPFSVTSQVSYYQKGKASVDFTEARDSEWQWHQLGHMQVCTSLQTDNHASTPPLSFLQTRCPSCRPTNSINALKANTDNNGWKFITVFPCCDAVFECCWVLFDSNSDRQRCVDLLNIRALTVVDGRLFEVTG